MNSNLMEIAAVVIRNPDGTHEVVSIMDNSDYERLTSYVRDDGCDIVDISRSTGEADEYIKYHGLRRAYIDDWEV